MPKYEVQIQDYSGEWVGCGRYEFLGNAVFYAGQHSGAQVVELATGKVVGQP
ncbi:UNVERIFIED_ORG: carbohydrate-binding DOMON domain-containing protein [Pseudomonas parafulva]|nr:carbohydrate-binding DOMON domain-containing protein [Pseudomonas parafulva]